MLLESYTALREQKGESYYATRSARENLHRLYVACGKAEKAQSYPAARTGP